MKEINKNLLLTTVVLAAMAMASPAQAAPPFDLTGTWQGTYVCTDFIGGKPINFVLTDETVLISQDGNQVRMDVFGEPHEGVTQTAARNKSTGEAIVTACDTASFQEMVRIKRIRADSWDAVSVFLEPEVPVFSDCVWAFERVSDEDPEVAGCP